MIPYVPEGPPPLDDEDTGSPIDAPVGFPGVLHSITAAVGAPFGDFASAFPTPQAYENVSEGNIPGEITQENTQKSTVHVENQLIGNKVQEVNDKETKSEITSSMSPNHQNDSPREDNKAFTDFPASGAHECGGDVEFENDFDDFQSASFPVVTDDNRLNTNSSISPTSKTETQHLSSVCDDHSDDGVTEDPKTSFQENSISNFPDNQLSTNKCDSRSENETPVLHAETEIVSGGEDNVSGVSDDSMDQRTSETGDKEPSDKDGNVTVEKSNVLGSESDFETKCSEAANDTMFTTSDSCIPKEKNPGEEDFEVDDEFGSFSDFNSAVTTDNVTFPKNGFPGLADSQLNTSNLSDFHATSVDDHVANNGESVEKDDFERFKDFNLSDDDVIENSDDFGDFGDFSQPAEFQAFDEGVKAVADDEFTAFSEPDEWHAAKPADKGFVESVEFASFENFEVKDTNIKVNASNELDSGPGGLLEKILDKMETVLSTCFSHSDEIADESLSLDTLNSKEKDSNESDCIWTFLVDFDKAFALRYQLAKSRGNDCFLKALNIDSRNVLKNPKKPTLPIFASQLGLLEPTRGSAEGGKDNNTALDSSVVPTDSDSSIPAPEFDWNSSGLTNPLDKLEEQFLCKELTNTSSPITSEVKLDPVQSILTQATRGASVPLDSMKDYSELSSIAQAYVDVLPDLSYMKARVLMFPIGHS